MPGDWDIQLGSLVITAGISDLINDGKLNMEDIDKAINDHRTGEWGIIPEEDKDYNRIAIREGMRVMSAWPINDIKIWIITEWDRTVTTVLLPEEY